MSKFWTLKQCEVCGKDFRAHLKCQKYCSKECREEAERRRKKDWEERHRSKVVIYIKTCPTCGQAFETLRGSQIYCSIGCKRAANRAVLKAPVKVKKCIICGAEFETNKPDTLTCSKKCSYIRHLNVCNTKRGSEGANKICPICGAEFEPYRSTQVYCSPKCRDVDTTLRKCRKHKDLRLEYKFKDEAYTEIHRDVFIELMRQIFHRERARAKKRQRSKTLDDWIREADACKLSYGIYRASVEVLGKSFDDLKNESLST